MGWLIALGILVLIAILPVGARVEYSAQGFYLYLLFGLLRIKLLPQDRKKPKKEKPEPKKQEKIVQQKPGPKPKTEEKTGGKLTDFIPLVQVGLDFLGSFRRKLRLNRLELKLTMAADDPCDLAINYGRAWAAVGNLMPMLERLFVIKKRNVEVQCDFTANDTVIYARLDITITIGRIFGLVFKYGYLALRELLKINNSRKGGAKS